MDNERGSAVGQEAYQKLGWKAESAEGRAEGGVEVRTWAMVRAYLPPAGSASHPAACARASTGYSRRSRSCSSAWPNCASQAGVRPTSKPLQGARPGVTGGPEQAALDLPDEVILGVHERYRRSGRRPRLGNRTQGTLPGKYAPTECR